MLNVVITERRIVVQSIDCVNNASAAPSHYASLMSNLWFILVRLSIYRNSGTGNESISFSSSFWSSCLLFWCRVSGDVFHIDYMFIMQVITNKSVIKLLLSHCMFAYVQLSHSVCLCGCAQYVCSCLFCCLSYPPVRWSNHQRANLESCFASYTSPCYIFTHSAWEIHEFDYTSGWFFHIAGWYHWSSSQQLRLKRETLKTK